MPGWFDRSALAAEKPHRLVVARGQHHHPQRRARPLVAVDDVGHRSQQAHQVLGARARGLGHPSQDDGARRGRGPAAGGEAQVLAHEAEDVQQRPLVARERAHADVHEGLEFDLDAGGLPEVGREALAARAAGGAEGAPKGGIEGQGLEPAEGGGIGRPALPQRLGQEPRDRGVALLEPAPREDRRRPRAERLAAQHRQVAEGLGRGPLPRRRDVGVRGADDRERPGPEPRLVALAEEREPAAPLAVAGPPGLGFVEVAPVHLVEDLEEPGLLGLQEREEPEGARGLAPGAAEARHGGAPGQGPGLVPGEPLLVEEDAEHLGHGEGGALVGEEERPSAGQGGAHRALDQGHLLTQPLRVAGVPAAGRREDVGHNGVRGRAQGGHDLVRALGAGLGGDDVNGAFGHALHSAPVARRGGAFRGPAV